MPLFFIEMGQGIVAAGMELSDDGKTMNAGGILDMKGDFDQADQIQLQTRKVGTYTDHGGFTLVGENREVATKT